MFNDDGMGINEREENFSELPPVHVMSKQSKEEEKNMQ
jgi:hypothetical protein